MRDDERKRRGENRGRAQAKENYTERRPEDNQPTTIKDELSLSWLVVFCLLSPYLTINPGKRYEEVDGVRKEKERLTTDPPLEVEEESKRSRLREPKGSDGRFSCLKPGLDWTRLFISLTAGAGTRCMSPKKSYQLTV